MAESPTIADRFKMPDIYESGIRGANGKSPAQRQADADAKAKTDKEAKLKAKKKAAGKGLDDADDDEIDPADKPAKKKGKSGYVLISKSAYDKHIGSKKPKK